MGSTDAPRRKTFVVNLGAEAVADDTPYVLVDLSDSTNFPHGDTNWIDVLGVLASIETHTDGQYDIWLGVVIENDGTDGTAEWFDVLHCENRQNASDGLGHFHFVRDYTLGGANPDGINCKVTSGATPYLATAQSQADNGNWQNDTNRTSPVGATTKPGAGDVVVWVEEAGGAGTCDFSLTLIYEAH